MTTTLRSILVIALWFLPAWAHAQMWRIDPAGIPGSLLICGGGDVSGAAFDRFIELAGGAKAKVAVVVVDDEKAAIAVKNGLLKSAKKKDAAEPRIVLWEKAKAALPNLTGVWLITSSHYNISRESPNKEHPGPVDFLELLRRSGVVATSGIHSEILREVMLLDPYGLADLRLPSKGEEKKRKLAGFVIFDVEPGAALLIKGRTLSAVGQGVIGEGATTIWLGKSKTLTARTITLKGKAQEDLTALRRAVRDRADGFPPKQPESPVLEKGTLVIVGGGGSPENLHKKFVEYAGGEGKAVIVIFATAAEEPLPKREGLALAFKKAGAKKATVLYGRTRAEVESTEFLDALEEATGLWFDGGRQWRFVDCYENTKALPLMFDVLQRGGVIGGTSAGATIQGDYLARGGVFNNFDIRYEGYERGLGFLKGVAIDQHFSQRKRQKDMTSLMKTYPQYLGIGLDEATAIVVKGSVAEVIGKGNAHFYDAKRKVVKGDPDYEALSAGGRYELKERKVLNSEK